MFRACKSKRVNPWGRGSTGN